MKEGKHEEIAGWRKKGIVPRSYLQIINPDMPNEPHAGHENESAQNVSASVLSDSKTEEHVSSSSGAESPKEDRHGDLPPTILRRHDETKEATTPNDSVVKNNPQTNGTKSIVFDVQDEEETSGCCVRCFSFKKPKNVL
ncbi:hypothetical protein GUITHDRAFT_153106 [Guillardia theta CCMP2712]|uniref:Uncharacterized protein n=2 Tax=Guillardia theta TaxID=55529 RepID=L1J756_GUITC|nr:hypothetical protein GUITHDRAFT_153106 [Guillardia theta CCMP2712]EKX43934.1 hypothetical protein GUITHDRAFT_153106 [Guillardia theta CCMP2712]|eukprot:XP_005830914.1 hypothetical protein GUITHDRAFT_153106 [Guillardia theta CCMP2712]